MGAGHLAAKHPAELSPGELRRVALARGLARIEAGARVLLLDEPTAHLDRGSATLVNRALAGLRGKVTVLLVAHDRHTRDLADTLVAVTPGAGGHHGGELPALVPPLPASAGGEPGVQAAATRAHARHREVEQDDLRPEPAGELDRLLPVAGLADHGEVVLLEQRGERLARDGVVVYEQDPHRTLIGSARHAEKGLVQHEERDDYAAWLWGEVLLIGLLGAALALFVANPSLRNTYSLPQVRLVLDTAVTLAALIVALLAGIRFTVDGRRLDLLLCGGFAAAAGATLAFSIAPVLGGEALQRTEFWAGIGGRLFAATLIAAAPFSRRRVNARGRALGEMLAAVLVVLALCWALADRAGTTLPPWSTAPAPTSRSS